MCNAKINPIFILFLTLQVQEGYGLPQGFTSFPVLLSWNNEFLTILSNVEIQSPASSSFIYVFGIQDSVDNSIDVSKEEQQLNNINKIEQEEDKQTVGQNYLSSVNRCGDSAEKISYENNNTMKFLIDQEEKQLNNEFNAIFRNTTESDNKIVDADTTTKSIIGSTTADIETTTVDDDIFDRGNPALIASMIG